MNPTETSPGLVVQKFTPPLRLSDFKLIAFDMDSTLINIECVDEIADVVGRKEEVAAITEAAMRGEITDYKDSLRRRVALLRGVTVADMERVCTERMQLNPGARELVAACKAAGLKVLLVEDSAIARQFLKRRLYHLGYKVHECASGEAALELLSKRTFGMAFLDIALGPPGSIDGLQLCQRLKQRGAHAAGLRTVVVMVTGLDGATDRVRGSLAGCDAYLTKPLHEAEFIATLQQVDPEFVWESAAAPASV